jgi:hypothetical protein
VALAGVLDQLFETDEATDPIACLIEQKESQKPRHAPVAVEKRVDAEEVEDIGREDKQRLQPALAPRGGEAPAQALHGFSREKSRCRLESPRDGAVRMPLFQA